ncbi:MAG TPA: hypothetical protein VNR64_11055, partial [Vicinamibacterales bacterium]|nr:hypothetical protein [Vicinamibacterales bacterium]
PPRDIVPARANDTSATLAATPRTEVSQPRFTLSQREEKPPAEERGAKLVPEVPPVALADQVVVHALDSAQPAFMACFHLAQRRDPTLISAKITMHIYVEPSGMVMSAHSDVTEPRLDGCLVRVASRMQFPPPKALAVADMTFFAW